MKTGKGYAGKYKMGEDNILEVTTVDNHVFLEIPKAGKFELFKKGGAADTFYPKAFEATIAFNKNEEGEVIDYSSEVFARGDDDQILLPKLARQFTHYHTVKSFSPKRVEIRILDYEIDRSVDSSPADLFFK